MKQLGNIFSIIVVFFTVLSFQACFDEDMSDCPSGIKIYFDFTRATYSSAKEGINPEDLDLLNLYVFDMDGILINEYKDENPIFGENYYMEIPDLPTGSYYMVAWGGLKEDYSLSGELIPGETTMQNVYVYLNCIDNTNQTVTTQINPLFFATKDDPIEVINGLDLEDRLALVQNTYKVNITVNGLKLGNEDYELSIEDNVGIMNFDNSVVSVGRFNYKTTCAKSTKDLTGSLSLLRLMDNRTPTLRLTNNIEPEPLFEQNLVEMILAIRTVGGKVDFSYMHEFNIELTANANLEFTITINGWVVAEEGGELGV